MTTVTEKSVDCRLPYNSLHNRKNPLYIIPQICLKRKRQPRRRKKFSKDFFLVFLLFLTYLWYDNRAIKNQETQPNQSGGYSP